uniref:Putative secreted protein n=1 Tax=Anopheles darlingi TaxID=43151 RepID=A0A2M4D7V4_ANODA
MEGVSLLLSLSFSLAQVVCLVLFCLAGPQQNLLLLPLLKVSSFCVFPSFPSSAYWCHRAGELTLHARGVEGFACVSSVRTPLFSVLWPYRPGLYRFPRVLHNPIAAL